MAEIRYQAERYLLIETCHWLLGTTCGVEANELWEIRQCQGLQLRKS